MNDAPAFDGAQHEIKYTIGDVPSNFITLWSNWNTGIWGA